MIAALLGGESYLVGSALRPDNPEPRDWDVRLLMANEGFALRYWPKELRADESEQNQNQLLTQWRLQRDTGLYDVSYWRWADEMVRYSDMGRKHTGLNIDFQAYPTRWFDTFGAEEGRLRLDTRGRNFRE